MELTGDILTCLLSGANWDNSTNAGLGASNWNNNRANSNNNVGGRCDYSFASKPERAKWSYRDILSGVKRNIFTPFFLVGNPKTRMGTIQ